MVKMRFSPGVLALGFGASLGLACRFDVSWEGSHFACPDGRCPAGFTCSVNEMCEGGGPLPAIDAAESDAPIADAAVADARPADATLADAPPPDAQPCSGGTTQIVDPQTGHCYRLFNGTKVAWLEARLACAGLGVGNHLAMIGSAAENAILTQLAGAGITDAWLGATDSATEGTWRWVDNTLVIYTNWRMGEPNNANGNEDCMVAELDTGATWDDRDCTSTLAYVCERD
jgi:hypothetical protein